jgi:antitoxin component of RelBE/YafQ-DinJ toxin-antitoxin module
LLKQSVTIRLDRATVEYFKELAARTDLPYQQLINLYLRECAIRQKEPSMRWVHPSRRTKRSTRRPAARAAGER